MSFVIFFRNLLMGEHNELKNRYLLVNPPEEWKAPTSTPQVPYKYPYKLLHKTLIYYILTITIL